MPYVAGSPSSGSSRSGSSRSGSSVLVRPVLGSAARRALLRLGSPPPGSRPASPATVLCGSRGPRRASMPIRASTPETECTAMVTRSAGRRRRRRARRDCCGRGELDGKPTEVDPRSDAELEEEDRTPVGRGVIERARDDRVITVERERGGGADANGRALCGDRDRSDGYRSFEVGPFEREPRVVIDELNDGEVSPPRRRSPLVSACAARAWPSLPWTVVA